MNIRLLLLPGFFLYASVGPAQTLKPGKPEESGLSTQRLTRIDAAMNDYVKSGKIPGAVALIVRNGRVVYHKAFGYSNVEKQVPLKTDDVFRIASQTKAITSLAIMMLFEEGKFLLDDPVSRYIPEFKNPRVLTGFNWQDSTYTAEPAKSEITIRQLLTHTSGLDYAAIGSQEFKALYAKHKIPSGIGTHQSTLANTIPLLAGLPLKHHPGERFTYGLNTDVLGYLVEVLSGQPFDQFLMSRIFLPLGMNNTFFFLPADKRQRLVTLYHAPAEKAVERTALIYDGSDPNYPIFDGTYFSGGAGLSSTTEDYAKFLQLFLSKGEFNGVRLLSRKTVELMLTNQIQITGATNQFGLGFGLETDKNDYNSIVSKGTFNWAGAFNTHYWADPAENLIGIVFTNMYSSPYWSIGDRYKVLVYQSISN